MAGEAGTSVWMMSRAHLAERTPVEGGALGRGGTTNMATLGRTHRLSVQGWPCSRHLGAWQEVRGAPEGHSGGLCVLQVSHERPWPSAR